MTVPKVKQPLKVILIAAMDLNGAIGYDDDLPWRSPADLRRFRSLTLNKVCLMGRKTAESLPKALRDRINIVYTRDKGYQREGFVVCNNMAKVRKVLKAAGTNELWVLGGGEIYRKFIHRADLIHLTIMQVTVPHADTYFPTDKLDEFEGSICIACEDPLVKFWTFTRKPVGSSRDRDGVVLEMQLNVPVAKWLVTK